MILYLAALNFLLAIFDTWLTARRIRDYGVKVETNGLIRFLSTHVGPELGALLGVTIPAAMWTYLLVDLHLPVALALLVGWNLKRFDRQLASLEFEKKAGNVSELIDAYNKIAGGEATLPSDSKKSKPPATSSKKKDGWKDYTPTDCK